MAQRKKSIYSRNFAQFLLCTNSVLWSHFFLRLMKKSSWFSDIFILYKLASSGPYRPFLAIQRAFTIRYWEIKFVGKCLVRKCQIGTCHQARESSFLLNGWTEWNRKNRQWLCCRVLLRSDDSSQGQSQSGKRLLLASRGHPIWSLLLCDLLLP